MSEDFGLRAAVTGDDYAALVRAQRDTALEYWQFAVADRMTAWLVANDYEQVER